MPKIEVPFKVEVSQAENETFDYIELMYNEKLKKKRRAKYLMGVAKIIIMRYGSPDNGFKDIFGSLKIIEVELKEALGCNKISWTLNYPAPEHSVSPDV